MYFEKCMLRNDRLHFLKNNAVTFFEDAFSTTIPLPIWSSASITRPYWIHLPVQLVRHFPFRLNSLVRSFERRRRLWIHPRGVPLRNPFLHCSATESTASQSSTTEDEEFIEVCGSNTTKRLTCVLRCLWTNPLD